MSQPSPTAKIQVVHFHRRPMAGQVSIERLFENIRRWLPESIACEVRICPRFSRGIWPRLVNLWAAAWHSGPVNHITGDVHYLALVLPRRRTLLTIHDCAALDRLRGGRRALLKLFWFTLPVWRARLVTVVSESTRRELMRHTGCAAAKIRVVPCCVGADFAPVPKPFAKDDPVILQLGTAANKNLERVIAALAGLTCRLNIIGILSENQRHLLEKHQIRYTNIPRATDAEVVQAYAGCDLVVFASTYEGFGLPIIEANATGRPVVTSRLLSMPEAAGAAACLVDPFDVAAIRAGILRVWQDADYRAELVAAGFENIKRFAPSAVAGQYAAIYQELAGRAGAPGPGKTG